MAVENVLAPQEETSHPQRMSKISGDALAVLTTRKLLGLHQDEFGELIGLHRRTVMNWESEKLWGPAGYAMVGVLFAEGYVAEARQMMERLGIEDRAKTIRIRRAWKKEVE